MTIDRESYEPPWRQLERLLREQIESGEIAPGSRLPSIVALSQQHELAITTVQKAVASLKQSGHIVTSPLGMFAKR